MFRGSVLSTLVMGLLLLPSGVAAPQDTGGEIDVVVEASRQVTTSANPVRLFNTPQVAVHPNEPGTVAVAAADNRNGGCFVHVSRDGGLSWSSGVDVAPPGEPFCVQRTFGPILGITFASDGTLYVATSNSSAERGHPNGPANVYLSRSDDLGRTFETTLVAEGGDATYETADGPVDGQVQHSLVNVTVAPDDPDTVLVGWRWRLRGDFPFGAVPSFAMLAMSTDGGASFSEPLNLNEASGFPEGAGYGSDTAMAAVTPDGTFYAFAQERPPRGDDIPDPAMIMYRSTDQGASWTGEYIAPGQPDIDSPAVAVGGGGELYLTWAQRFDDKENPLDPVFVRSLDGGDTWSEPVIVADDDPARGISQYFPGMSVAPNGRIDIAFWDFRDDPFFQGGEVGSMGTAVGQRFGDLYYTSSTDGGQTWSRNVRVTDRSIDTDVGTTFNNQDVRGPVGVASTNDATYAVWADSRAGTPDFEAEDAYFTRIRHAGGPSVATTTTSSKVMWSIIGGGAGLALGGLILLFGTRRARRADPARQAVPAGGSQ